MEGTACAKLQKSEGGMRCVWGVGGRLQGLWEELRLKAGKGAHAHSLGMLLSLCSGNEIENKQTSEMRIYFEP